MAKEEESDGVESRRFATKEPKGDDAVQGAGVDETLALWSPELDGGWRVGGEEDEGGSGDLPTHFGLRQVPLFKHLFLLLHLEQMLHLGTLQLEQS